MHTEAEANSVELWEIGRTKLWQCLKAMNANGIEIPKSKLLSPKHQKQIFEYCGFGVVEFIKEV